MKYKIDPEILHRVAQEVVSEILNRIRESLAEEFPCVIEKEERCWIGNRAGGVLGKMTLLDANFNEDLIIFGAPVEIQ